MYQKYLKYKKKYLHLKNLIAGMEKKKSFIRNLFHLPSELPKSVEIEKKIIPGTRLHGYVVKSKKNQATFCSKPKCNLNLLYNNYIDPPHPETQRGALCCIYNDIIIINIHLKSGEDYDWTRKNQLLHFFSNIEKLYKDRKIILFGDI